jgi:predicted TIM-barrel fold metal-dependent hydrolase
MTMKRSFPRSFRLPVRSALLAGALGLLAALVAHERLSESSAAAPLFNDSHLHLTNYVQKGIDVRRMLALMGTRVPRATLFGIPLQQQWSYRVSGDFAPRYYLDSDAPLYYYSFTDAHIAMAYRSLSRELRARFDPMITGFNPADMYAADHIRRVLETFPGVFSGIGEFSIHKEFVSSKVAGGVASLTDPALDRLLAFAGEVGLVVLLHNDIDMPFAKEGAPPVYLAQLLALFRRHPRTTFIWAHLGVGRVVHPIQAHGAMVRSILTDPTLAQVNFDLSWSETAKYLVGNTQALQVAAEIIHAHPDRFLFGTDEVAPEDEAHYLRTYDQYQPLWKRLGPADSDRVRRTNYERLFDQARRRVRAWEARNLPPRATGEAGP